MFFPDRYRSPLSITFAFVATHNHFVLDRGGKVFKQTAPIIKLPETATEDDHLALLAYLNSSTACFWMKQVFFDKGGGGIGGGLASSEWEKFFEFDGTKMKLVPLPKLPATDAYVAAARNLESLARTGDGLDERACSKRCDRLGSIRPATRAAHCGRRAGAHDNPTRAGCAPRRDRLANICRLGLLPSIFGSRPYGPG